MTIAEECVKRGAALLDQDRPGWVDHIDIAQVDVSSATKCPLAQVYGSYYAGVSVLALAFGPAFGLGYGYGFSGSRDADCTSLTVAWRELIARRRLEPLKVREPVSEPVEAVAP